MNDKHTQYSRQGFTLIEMAIVMVIIGVLITITMPLVRTMVTQTKQVEERAGMKESKEALLGYAMTHGGFPDPLTDNAIPAGILGIQATGPYAKPFLYDVNDALKVSATGGDMGAFCSAVFTESTNRNPPLMWDGQDYSDPLLSNPVSAVIVSRGKNLNTDGENQPLGDGTLGDRTYENISRAMDNDYDDMVNVISLAILCNQCNSLGYPCAAAGAPPPPPPTTCAGATPDLLCSKVSNNSGVDLYFSVAKDWASTDGDCNLIAPGETVDVEPRDKNWKLYIVTEPKGSKCDNKKRISDSRLKDIDTNTNLNAEVDCTAPVLGSCNFM